MSMAYWLSFDGDPIGAVRRVADERLLDAVEQLRDGADPVTAVHEARKDLKKTRAVLRLVRSGLKPKHYARLNRQLRDAGRELSGARDADVMAQTLAALGERFSGHVPASIFAVPDLPEAPPPDLDAHAGTLAALATAVAGWPLERVDETVWAKGIATSYARGRAAFAEADGTPSTENLHRWRKRVKDLWYHERLLSTSWNGVLKAHAKATRTLSQLLGDDHDLAVLAQHVDDPELLELISRRRLELLAEARALGHRIYAEKPKAFRRRIARYVALAAGREDAAVVGAR